MKCFASIFLILFFIGCGSSGITQKTIVQDRIVNAASPEIDETLSAVKHDTVVVAHKIVKHDTVVTVKYFPKTNTIYVHIKPDSVKIIVHDTIQTFTGYTDNDLDAGKSKAFQWGFGCALVLCVGIGGLLKFKGII